MPWVIPPLTTRRCAMDGSGPLPFPVEAQDVGVIGRVHAALTHQFPHLHPVARYAISGLVRFCDGWRRLFPARWPTQVVPALTTWEQFLTTEPRSRRIMVTVQPLGVETAGGTWAPVLLARVARWYRDSRGVRRQNQPLDVWVARLGREGSDARQRVQDADVLTAAITCEDGGLQVVRLSLDDAALTPDAVAALLARTPSRSLAEARRDGLFPQVLVDRASRGDSAWTSHLLTSSAWLGARVDAATGALELSFDHLVMDGTAMAELSLAASEGLPRREGRAAPGEWLTGPEEPSPLLRVELPEGLDFRNLACAMLQAVQRAGEGVFPVDNPTLLVPVLPASPHTVARKWRRIGIAVVPSRTRTGPMTPAHVAHLLEQTRRGGGVLKDIFSTLYSPALPWWMPSLTTHGFAFTPLLRQVPAALGGNALLSKITLEVDDDEALARHSSLFFNTMRPLSAVGGGVALCVTEVLHATPSGVRKRFFAALAGSGALGSREKLLAFRDVLVAEAVSRARPRRPALP
ncbi:hypothetical protein MXAN_2346 [Myxococcus xanthus DK 1622]|uniref:Uncharacterized protein n=2 Tax=Myxococcaceae TaxID=31 RepID=Q1D9V7_MYXXD|nr:hypothetical protein MXAN_2346 [Myxococcus xanthus DK 1622]NOJ56700.1 hypothetical protein [Myxococcus xanthus]QPM81869.1 hypothetical protein I5Q59_11630 [Myxococcus xanthus]QVW71119.1 hypothetical protein JTM82_16985 [Myxococcus xanthus DZ2]UEO02752.1 hypothetical protein K1515_25820 [Myxococcus xanthus DZ2]